MYVLRSECGTFVKVGISNSSERRIAKLRKSTPFDFCVIEKLCSDGEEARCRERYFKKTHRSAMFRGFDGATEWLMWSEDFEQDLLRLTSVSRGDKLRVQITSGAQ